MHGSLRRATCLAAALLLSPLVRAPLPAQSPNSASDKKDRVDIKSMILQQLGGSAKDAGDSSDKKFEEFDKVVKGAKEHEGLFQLYLKNNRLYGEIRQDQLDTPFLCPISIARGMGMGGTTLNMGDQWVLVFKRAGDKVLLIRRNLIARADSGTPISHAVETSYTDSVLKALPIQSIHPTRQSILLNFNDIFMGDFIGLGRLGLGMMDVERSTWHKVKAFPKNVELYVEATFDTDPQVAAQLGDAVADPRGNTIVIHYGLCKLPEDGYQPRLADDRVGHFLNIAKDFSSESFDTNYRFYVTRWRLDRSTAFDAKHPDRLSPPKKRIVYWIEKSVPHEYRAAVRDGILEWNKAFAKIGFRDAIEVRQQETEDFDPEDINYSTFRWITSDQAYAIGPSRWNPFTGEILDADILFDASMIRAWQNQQRLLQSGGTDPKSLAQFGLEEERFTRPLLTSLLQGSTGRGWRHSPKTSLLGSGYGPCLCGAKLPYELGMAAMLEAAKDPEKGTQPSDEMIQQALKYVVMHEVGHTLGLRHNFKGSAMLPYKQLHDTAVTREKGLVGSVMDYVAVNLAPKGVKQGDYYPTTLGPYDYWVIEYAYKPLSGGMDFGSSSSPAASKVVISGDVGNLGGAIGDALKSLTGDKGSSSGGGDSEKSKLHEIARRCAKPGHDYATDEDAYGGRDPEVAVWDIGADPLEFARDRVRLADELFKNLPERVVEKGESYERASRAFMYLLRQYVQAGGIAARYIGGEAAYRDHRGDPDGRDPYVPVAAAKQRAALKFLQEHILTEQHFKFPPELLRRLGADYFMDVAQGTPLQQYILSVQTMPMRQLLSPQTLWRVQNVALRSDAKEKPLALAEVFRCLSDGVWGDQPAGGDQKSPADASVFRRNLQRAYLKLLGELVLGPRPAPQGDSYGAPPPQPAPAEARSLCKMHMREIDKSIEKLLSDKDLAKNEAARAHWEDCREYVAKILAASVQLRD